jgi:hypothetical protein
MAEDKIIAVESGGKKYKVIKKEGEGREVPHHRNVMRTDPEDGRYQAK